MAIQKIDFAQAKQLMDDGDFVLLDVREEDEYRAGHASDAVLLPVGRITADTAAECIPDSQTTVLLYCRTGRRSQIAAKKLDKLGYTKLYDLGGLFGWPYGMDYGI